MAQSSQFYLTLPSNTQVEGNTTSEFRVELPSAIELEGQWEVGLAEILYPGSYDTLHGSGLRMNVKAGIQTSRNGQMSRYTKTVTVKVPDGHYSTIVELLAAINFAMFKTERGEPFWYGEGQNKKLKGGRFEYEPTIKKVKLIIAKTADGENAEWVDSITLDKRLHHMLGFENAYLGSSQLAKYPVDLKAGLESLFVYCNLIAPQWVGDVRTNLLKILPLRGSPGDTISIDCPTVHFVDLLTNRFSTVEINIKGSDGGNISWAYGKIFVKLAFRKKKIR